MMYQHDKNNRPDFEMLMVPGGVQESRLQEAGFMFNMEKSVWYTRAQSLVAGRRGLRRRVWRSWSVISR